MVKLWRHLLAFAFAAVVLTVLPAISHASLSINEIMGDPATDWDGDGEYEYRYDEWVELYNPGPGAIGVLILEHRFLGSND